MPFELNRELKDAQNVVKAARKENRALAEVGVTKREIADAAKLLDEVLGARKELALQMAQFKDEIRDRRALIREGKELVSAMKRRIGLAFEWDLERDEELREAAGIGSKVRYTAASVATAAAAIAETAVHPRWARALRRRGVTASHAARLKELAAALKEEADAPMPSGQIPLQLHRLLRTVSYLRQAAATVFEATSRKYSPFRPRAVTRPRQPEAAKPEPQAAEG